MRASVTVIRGLVLSEREYLELEWLSQILIALVKANGIRMMVLVGV